MTMRMSSDFLSAKCRFENHYRVTCSFSCMYISNLYEIELQYYFQVSLRMKMEFAFVMPTVDKSYFCAKI